jgi:hypothetical protein
VTTPEDEVIAQCKDRLAQIDAELVVLVGMREKLIAEAENLGLRITAASDPSLLNRGSKR